MIVRGHHEKRAHFPSWRTVAAMLRRVNVLSEEKKQQIIALGKQDWSLRRIERTVHIRRETAAAYLKGRRSSGPATGRVGTARAGKNRPTR